MSADTNQLVSVLMPVRNAARFLPTAIESILAQTYENFELLIFDDGSTDDSASIAERYAQRDSRVRVVRRQAAGLVDALNAAVQAARGELLARFDGDDVALPERLALQVTYMNEHPECVALGGQVVLIDEDGDPIGPSISRLTHAEIERDLLTGRGLSLVHPSSMLRKQAVLAIGGYQEFPSEDLDMFLRLGEYGKLANLPQTLLYYRKHATSISARERKDEWRAARLKIVTAALARRGSDATPSIRSFSEPDSIDDLYARWARQAANAGNFRTANKYLRKMILSSPLGGRTWRSMAAVWARRIATYLPPPLVDRWRRQQPRPMAEQ